MILSKDWVCLVFSLNNKKSSHFLIFKEGAVFSKKTDNLINTAK